jgi:NADPH:quinone reductase-like Zn-dependent oxidoreductase
MAKLRAWYLRQSRVRCQSISLWPGEATRRPPSLAADEAARYALVGLTAYVALFEVYGIQPGQSVFVGGSHLHVY